MQIMAEMYAALLEDAGYAPTLKGLGDRALYAGELGSGKAGVRLSMTEYFNKDINGPDAKPVASPDVDETLATLEELGLQAGVTPLEPAEAEDANAFAVTTIEFLETNGVTTLSDLGNYDSLSRLPRAPDCPDRDDCKLGPESVYGVEISISSSRRVRQHPDEGRGHQRRGRGRPGGHERRLAAEPRARGARDDKTGRTPRTSSWS